ncbi:MAG: 2-dehydro-3-deoxyglucarate aldolase [Gammaproteobacteria bacterium]|nr:2-dehydro-3-deoxyglucarate aldolase [Gammaproteobacteria bacterium]
MSRQDWISDAMKRRLAAGDAALGCSVMIPSPQMVEMVGHLGFDWVLVDMEHGTIGIESAELMIMAAQACGISAIVRPPGNRSAEISAVMDRGAHGVQVPHVNSAEDARRAVAAVKFGAGAQRGLAAGTRPDRYGLGESMPDFVSRSNAATLVCVQIEHEQAVLAIDELLDVESVDVYFIGPSDLSQSMGHPGNPKAPPVANAIDSTLRRIVTAGRIPGMPATSHGVAALLDQGVRYIYTHLPRLLQAGGNEFLRAAGR